MKYLFLTIFSLLVNNSLIPTSVLPGKDCQTNFIHIAGETNINNFQFDYNFPVSDPFVITTKQLQNSDSAIFYIHVPVKDFRTTNGMMHKDFMDLLKEQDYPYIIIGIPVKELVNFSKTEPAQKPDIKITLAGVSRNYKIECQRVSCKDNVITLSGTQTIDLTRFDLKPPEKFYGLVKVKTNVMINFLFSFVVKS